MSDLESPQPEGYDFFADASGARSIAHTLEQGLRFAAQQTALERLEQSAAALPGRLQVAHDRGILLPATLGPQVARLTQRLAQAAIRTRSVLERWQGLLGPDIQALAAQVAANDKAIEADGLEAHGAVLAESKRRADALSQRMVAAEGDILAAFSEMGNEVRALDKRLHQLERASELLAGATFQLLEGERLAEASEGRYFPGTGEIQQGVLFLTERRLLFEQREEVQRRGRFLPFSRREQRHELTLDEPLNHIAEATVGRPLGSAFAGNSLNLRVVGGRGPQERAVELQGQETPWQQRLLALRDALALPPAEERR